MLYILFLFNVCGHLRFVGKSWARLYLCGCYICIQFFSLLCIHVSLIVLTLCPFCSFTTCYAFQVLYIVVMFITSFCSVDFVFFIKTTTTTTSSTTTTKNSVLSQSCEPCIFNCYACCIIVWSIRNKHRRSHADNIHFNTLTLFSQHIRYTEGGTCLLLV